MTIYVDITQLEKGRANTGIQRVVKEFLNNALKSSHLECKIIIFAEDLKTTKLLDNQEVIAFLKDIENYKFKKLQNFDLFNTNEELKVFFDMDSTWNITYRRNLLYPKLKLNNFLIFNFIHDTIPIILEDVVHNDTLKSFPIFLQAVYDYSDLVLFNSYSSNNDFLRLKEKFNCKREIPTRYLGLGSDFYETEEKEIDFEVKELLDKKYILFVGTLEPRKNQGEVLEAFEKLCDKYKDLNLIFIGKKGWKIDDLAHKITNHPLFNKRIFWPSNIDDYTLSKFYQNAFLVTYLSKYEGYGLPIAEALRYGNITITSKNSSMYEVGRDFADYVIYNSLNELTGLISLYIEDNKLYETKKQYIKENFKTISWLQFYTSVYEILINFEKSINFKAQHLNKLQFVFISINKHNLEGTIKAIDKYVDFVSEYIIVTQKKYLESFKQIETKNKITVLDENIILGDYKENFSKRDHVSKNWLLRASLLNIENLDEEFIMLDDDNRPLKNININKFITDDGKYNAFYFYNMLDWTYNHSDYDKGQKYTRDILIKNNYEFISYSCHCPQIINKTIFKEAINKFFDFGLNNPIEEWNIYFNYAISTYPYAFNKKLFETLAWPARPSDWQYQYFPEKLSFENYYKELYDTNFFSEDDTYDIKLEKYNNQINPYKKSQDYFKINMDVLSKNNMVHPTAKFETENMRFYLSNIPYFSVVEYDSDIKINLNYKLLNLHQKKLDLSIVVFLEDSYRTLRHIDTFNDNTYSEAIVEFTISAKNLEEGIYTLYFDILENNKHLYSGKSPYAMKLIVSKNKDVNEVLGNPKLLDNEIKKDETLKKRIKSIPFLGWFLRWSYNLLRLNNIKHNVYKQQKTIQHLEEIIRIQESQLQKQELQIKTIEEKYNTINSDLSKQIAYQSNSMQERIDQFILDNKINSKVKNEKD
ncbi:glycosyltransferase family 4 protein [Campylobacterota bacterium DY0563]